MTAALVDLEPEVLAQARRVADATLALGVARARVELWQALAAADDHWRNVGQHAMRWQMWAALTPGVTWADVTAAAHLCLHNRVLCDWTREEAAEVVTGLLEGWLSR